MSVRRRLEGRLSPLSSGIGCGNQSYFLLAVHPSLNRDLIVAGAVLHDTGHMLEFGEAVSAVNPAYKRPGRLVGGLTPGRDLVLDMVRELSDVNPFTDRDPLLNRNLFKGRSV